MKKIIISFIFILFCSIVLALSVRGNAGNPNAQLMNESKWKENGPFELSPERGRFALTYSLLEDKSFYFSIPVAQFTTPDLGYKNGKYVSLFAPGVSFLIMPGYYLGKMIGLSQVGAYATISIFALFNVILLVLIAKRLGAHTWAAMVGGLTFIFATPAYAYAASLYQHHISTFTVLLSVYILLKTKRIFPLIIIWFLFACSIPIDYPNLFFMVPISIYTIGRILNISYIDKMVKMRFHFVGILTGFGVVLPLLFFLWFNKMSYSNPLQFSGTVARVEVIDENGNPAPDKPPDLKKDPTLIDRKKDEKSAVKFFRTRNLLNGFYIHFISPDRGIVIYTPVILFGILGMGLLYKKNPSMLVLLLSIIGADVLLYSMWGDPWGGWAFGSRYLIPSYSIMAILISIALSQWKNRSIFLLFFLIVFSYSTAVNTLGAITSNRNPPQAEVLNLEAISGTQQKYTFERNSDFLTGGGSKSFVYQTYVKRYIHADQYYLILLVSIVTFSSILLILLRLSPGEKKP